MTAACQSQSGSVLNYDAFLCSLLRATLKPATAYLFATEGSSLKLMRRPFDRSLLKDRQLGSGAYPVSQEALL